MSKKIILITGTTSGIGKELLYYYLNLGNEVIGIDRNKNNAFDDKKNYKQIITDITNYSNINDIIINLIKENILPDIFILNAGINIYDNKEFFSILNFKKPKTLRQSRAFFGLVNQNSDQCYHQK